MSFKPNSNLLTNIETLVATHRAIKQKYPTSIVLFKADNFYQAFDNDACLLRKIPDFSFKNTDGKNAAPAKVEFPIAAFNGNLAKLLKGGYTVAVCSYRFTSQKVSQG